MRYFVYPYPSSQILSLCGQVLNIGGSQQAETMCFAFEKMHKENRKFLTQEEWDTLVEIVKKAYWDFPAVGGVDDLERFDFIIKKG